ncbi:MAG: type VI secretion system-associated FHA domain protein [Polyangiales bacterium]
MTNTLDGSVAERTFERFPVRIGRNPLNDLSLDFAYVSQFHAVLELNGRQLMLRDLGSRNGTHLRTGKMAPHTPTDLDQHGYEFAIATLFFQAYATDIAVSVEPVKPRIRGTSIAQLPSDADEARQAILAADATLALKNEVKPYYEAYRTALQQLVQIVSARLTSIPQAQRAAVLGQLLKDFPALANEADFNRLGRALSAVGAFADESTVLQALRDLAKSYVPSGTVRGPEDLLTFLAKLQSVLDAFLKSFIPLRDGYKQFESKMDIRRGTMRTSQMAKVSVETAPDPTSLSAASLDWSEAGNEAPRQIESTFADLMIHQVAMLDGVMRGVKSLLEELAPAAIERLAEKKGGLGFGPFRFEKLWKAYSDRHSDLADEEKETFSLIFGKQFVKAYTQLNKDDVSTSGTSAELQDGAFPPRQR